MTRSTVPPAGDAGDDEADGGFVAAGDGAVAGGGGAAVHCTSRTPAASMWASTATRRSKGVNWDESSPLASIPYKTAAISGFVR